MVFTAAPKLSSTDADAVVDAARDATDDTRDAAKKN